MCAGQSSNIPSNISQHIPTYPILQFRGLFKADDLLFAPCTFHIFAPCKHWFRTLPMLSRPYFVDGMNGISRLSEIWICETRHIPLSWDPDFQRKLDDVFFNCHCDIWSYNCLRPWLSGPFVGTLGPTCLSCEPNGGRARGRPDSPEVYSLAYLSVDCYIPADGTESSFSGKAPVSKTGEKFRATGDQWRTRGTGPLFMSQPGQYVV